jgi:hypothetical protein
MLNVSLPANDIQGAFSDDISDFEWAIAVLKPKRTPHFGEN